jgi:hypothetical protein
MADQPNLRLLHPIIAALPCAVQKENDRPFFLRREIGRNVNLITIGGGVNGDGSIQETGFGHGIGIRFDAGHKKKKRRKHAGKFAKHNFSLRFPYGRSLPP